MAKSKKILITGYFGMNNLGDDLLFIEALCKIPQEYEIYVNIPPNTVIGGKFVDGSVNLQKYKAFRDFNILSTRIDVLKHNYVGLIYWGGGLFPTRKFTLRNLLSNMLLGLRAKKRIICGCGIVPKAPSTYFRMFLQTIKFCSVRDEVSKKYVNRIGYNAVNCGDLYWGNRNEFHNIVKKKHTCLICLANPFNEEELRNSVVKQRYECFLLAISKVIQKIKNTGFTVEYMAFFHLSDEILINNLQRMMNTQDKVLVYGIDYTESTVDSLFASYDVGFCMRFHSILLAIKNNLPFVSINYDYKSEMLLEEAGLKEYGIRYGIRKSQFFGEEIELCVQKLISNFEKMIRTREKIMRKSSIFKEMKYKSVYTNYKYIFNLLEL